MSTRGNRQVVKKAKILSTQFLNAPLPKNICTHSRVCLNYWLSYCSPIYKKILELDSKGKKAKIDYICQVKTIQRQPISLNLLKKCNFKISFWYLKQTLAVKSYKNVSETFQNLLTRSLHFIIRPILCRNHVPINKSK